MTKSGRGATRCIGIKPATNVFHALRYAAEQDRAPNVFVTINFSRLGITDDNAAALFSDLRARVRRSWKHMREGRGLAIGNLDDVGSHENPDGKRHVHWLVRVPDDLRPWFEAAVEKFMRKLTGHIDLGSAIEIRDIYALGTLAKYILKGVATDYAGYFKMRAEDQGEVYGRRTFASRSIGHTARKAAAWKRKKPPGRPRQLNGPNAVPAPPPAP